MRTYKSALRRRLRGSVVRLTIDERLSDDLKEFIIEKLGVSSQDVFRFRYLGLSDFREMIADDRPDLLFPPYTPRFPERIRYMTRYAKPEELNLLGLSPLNLRQRLMDVIEAKIEHARAKRPARI